MKIKILADEVASQIAAGEVVERPASVVKELIENALDAGADQIEIRVLDAGKRLIAVSDNGTGIHPEDLPLTAVRHATSKLENAEDLFKVSTLGFRGEALASIGSVSHMKITSRSEDAQVGASLRVMGGSIEEPRPVGCPIGTTIEVANLFYNVPARLKFLKTDRTEKRHIDDVVVHYGLAYPDVRFKLTHDQDLTFQTTGKGNAREVLSAVYGVDIAQKMVPVIAEDEILRISGFVSPPGITRSNRREVLIFVNGRPVQDAALVKSLLQAYHTMLMKGRYPLAVLFIEIPVEQVDVNVHPTKAEVRFRDKGEVFRSVGKAVRRALLANTPVPGAGVPRGNALWGERSASAPSGRRSSWMDPGGWGREETLPEGTKPAYQPVIPDTEVPILRLIGQVAATYLIAEGPDGLYLVDQHAAHERILFEKFLAERADEIPSQQLLEAVHVDFSPSSADLVAEKLPLLNQLGFEVESFGHNGFVVRAIPLLLTDLSPEAALRSVVEDFEEDETPLESRIEEKIIARVCKRAAVKAGQALTGEEQKSLLRDLEACQSPRTCPHGRPTMIHLPVDLLEQKFGRKGPR